MSIGTRRDIVASVSNKVHPNCIVCSLANARGLHLDFVSDNNGGVTATFDCDDTLEGYRGFMHGGVISSILDGAMTHCMFAQGKTAVTAQMSIRFHHPILVRRMVTVSAHIEKSCPPLYLVKSEIIQASEIKATATGKFLDQPQLLIQGQEIS